MKGIVTHEISPGDSLQKIARLYGVEDWREIALINNLRSPYINSVFLSEDYKDDPRVAKVGSVILIPYKNSARTIDVREVETATYGIDIDLYQGQPARTHEEGAPSETGRDIRLAGGLENLSQQLKIRLATKEGAILKHPDFGSRLHLYRGKLNTLENQNKVRFEVLRCLNSDFRIQKVENIELITDQGNYYVRGKIYPIEPGKPFELLYFLE